MNFQSMIWLRLVVLLCGTVSGPLTWAFLDFLIKDVLNREGATARLPQNNTKLSAPPSKHLRQVLNHQFYCGVYVQFDDSLEALFNSLYGYRMAKPNLAKIVIRMIHTATMVFQRSGSKYLTQINFYLKKLKPRPVSKIGLQGFLDDPHVPDAKNYCVLLHLTGDDPHGYVGFGKLSGMCSRPRDQTHAMSMVVRHPDQQAQLDLTFVHEIGHLFGSEHDGIPGLIPGNIRCPLSENEITNYIMHPRSRQSYHENQRKFSECSIRSIQQHLAIVFGSGAYKSCLDSFSDDICGTYMGRGCLVEQISPEFTVDNCWPMSYVTPPLQWPQCTVTDGACCNLTSCKFSDPGTVCEAETKCHKAALCAGSSAECPEPKQKPNGTRCGDASCVEGLCSGSLCLSFGYEACLPTDVDRTEFCRPYCYAPSQWQFWSVPSNNCVPLCKLETTVPCKTLMTPGSKCGPGGVGWCTFNGQCQRKLGSNQELISFGIIGPGVITLSFVLLHVALLFWVTAHVVPGNPALSQVRALEREVDSFVDFIEATYPSKRLKDDEELKKQPEQELNSFN